MAVQRRLPRLFLERDLTGTALSLDAAEAHYLGHVLRLERGEPLIVFDGRGTERHATLTALHRRGGELTLAATAAPLPESHLDITLLQALPKGDAMDLIVQKAVELGVRRIVPVHTAFSVVRLDDERAARRLEHWQRIASSACEQCGRHTPPSIALPAPLSAALAAMPATGLRLALEPTAAAPLDRGAAPAGVVVAVGPEGGFNADDLAALDGAGFTRIVLGRRVLRAETAAIAACAAVQLLWGDL